MKGYNFQFEQIAADYDQSLPSHVIKHYVEKRTRFLMSQWPDKSARVLDVGAGTGVLAAQLQATGWQVIGIDLAHAMLRVMRHRAGVTAQANSIQLPFPDHTFDVVYSIATLHHVAIPAAVRSTVKEMVRVTRPGGVTVYWDHNPYNPYWPIIMARVPQDTGEERLIPESEIITALTDLPVKVTSSQSGFVADFIPITLLGLFQKVENWIETVPGIRRIACAHNVIVARKYGV